MILLRFKQFNSWLYFALSNAISGMGFVGTISTKHLPVFYIAKCEVGWYKLRRNHSCEARTSYRVVEGVAE